MRFFSTSDERPEAVALGYMRRPPPIDVEGLARRLGIRVLRKPMGDDAGSIKREMESGEPIYIIRLNSEHPHVRQRFTLAHEIGHFIKHRHRVDEAAIHDNAVYRSGLPEPMEVEANRYAAQLLMPLSAMQAIWREGGRTGAQFANRLDVSEAAAQIRLDQLKGTLSLMG